MGGCLHSCQHQINGCTDCAGAAQQLGGSGTAAAQSATDKIAKQLDKEAKQGLLFQLPSFVTDALKLGGSQARLVFIARAPRK
jgi:hypothetical protein